MRRFLESIGGLFGQVGFEVGMGLVSAFAISVVAFLKTASLGWIISIFIVVIVGMPIGFRGLGVLFLSLSEVIPANVKFVIPRRQEHEHILHNGFWENKYYTCLKVVNNEHANISECRAVVEISPTDFKEILFGIGEILLKWKNAQSETVLSAHGGEAILYVYEFDFGQKQTDNPYNNSNHKEILCTNFCICGDDRKRVTKVTDNKVRYVLSITLHGKLNQKDIKTKKKFYYLFVDFVLPKSNFPKVVLVETNSLPVHLEELIINLKYRIRMMSKKEREADKHFSEETLNFLEDYYKKKSRRKGKK